MKPLVTNIVLCIHLSILYILVHYQWIIIQYDVIK